MDLGIEGRTALICASSKGLGLACATALAREGCLVFINGRDVARLAAGVAQIERTVGKKVTPIQADISEEQGRAAISAACPEPDILVNNNHGP